MIVGLNLSDIMEVRHDGLKETSDYSLHLKNPTIVFGYSVVGFFVLL